MTFNHFKRDRGGKQIAGGKKQSLFMTIQTSKLLCPARIPEMHKHRSVKQQFLVGFDSKEWTFPQAFSSYPSDHTAFSVHSLSSIH